MALPSNITHYRQLAAALHMFHAEKFFDRDHVHPSKADYYVATGGGPHPSFAVSPDRIPASPALMDYWFQRRLPGISQDLGERMPRRTWPLVRNVVSSKAVALKEQVTIDFVDRRTGSGIPNGTFAMQRLLPLRLQETGWWAAMRLKEEMSVLFRSAASHYSIQQGEMVVSALAPFAFEITPWAPALSEPARAYQITVPVGGMGCDYDPEHEPRYLYQRAPGTPATYTAALVDEQGVPFATLPEAPGGRLLVNRHPVVVWKEQESPGPLPALPLSLYNAQVNLILMLSYADYAVYVGGHGTIAASKKTPNAPGWQQMGTDPIGDGTDKTDPSKTGTATAPVVIPGGVHALMQLPDDWQAQLFQSRVDPMAYAQWLQAQIKLAYLAEDMVAGMVDLMGQSFSNVSGKARMYEQAPRILAKSRREARLREQVIADLETWASFWNLLAPASEQIPLDAVTFRVAFSEIWSPDVFSDQSVVQAWQMASEMGLLDLIRLRQQIDQSTYEEAHAAFWSTTGTFKRAKAPLPDTQPGGAEDDEMAKRTADEARANLIDVRAGFRSPQSVQRALGEDPETVAREIAEDKARRDRLGIRSDADPAQTTGSGISQYPRAAHDEDGTLIPQTTN